MTIRRAVLYATLVVGLLDATDGVVLFGLHGQSPIKVLQYIGSGVLGTHSFADGLASAGLGLILHFAISLVVAAIYILASQRIPFLRTQWVLSGLLYGAAVWADMNLLLLPLTPVTGSPLIKGGLDQRGRWSYGLCRAAQRILRAKGSSCVMAKRS